MTPICVSIPWDQLAGLAELVIPLLVAALTVPLFQWLKRLLGFIDGLGPTTQRILVLVVSYAITTGAKALGVAVPDDIHLIGEAHVSALLSAALAMAIHASNKAKSPPVDPDRLKMGSSLD